MLSTKLPAITDCERELARHAMLRLMVNSTMAAAVGFVLTLVNVGCSPNANSGPAGGPDGPGSGGSPSAQEIGEPEPDADDEFVLASQPVLINGINLTFDIDNMTEPMCDTRLDLSTSQHTVTCYLTVTSNSSGESFAAANIAEGIDVSYEAVPVKGQIALTSCNTSANKLSYSCDVQVDGSEDAELTVRLKASDGTKEKQQDTHVQLSYTVKNVLGLVPGVETKAWSPDAAAAASAQAAVMALQGGDVSEAELAQSLKAGISAETIPGAKLAVPFSSITALCESFAGVLLAADSSVFQMLDRESQEPKFRLLIGAADTKENEDLSRLLAIKLGAQIELSCSNEAIFVGDPKNDRILKIDKDYRASVHATGFSALQGRLLAQTLTADGKLVALTQTGDKLRFIMVPKC